MKFQISNNQITNKFQFFKMQILERNIFFIKQFVFVELFFEIYLRFGYCDFLSKNILVNPAFDVNLTMRH